MSDTTTTPVLTVTERASEKILELRAAEENAEGLGLRVEVTGARGTDYTYDLSFEVLEEAAADDVVHADGGLSVMIPADSVEALRGATLDLPRSEGQSGLVLRNPNQPNPLVGGDIELSGDTSEKITQLLDEMVNPALAAHGGYARLEFVEGDAAHVTMGGGCQGCAISAMTLRDGIERAIKEHVPEVREVVDATDHAAGENPFY